MPTITYNIQLGWWVGLMRFARLGLQLVVVAVLATNQADAQTPKPADARLSQGQAALRFLRAVLGADYPMAYGWLTPEVRRTVSLHQFENAAHSLWKRGQGRTPKIELYKLGIRLTEAGSSRLFYSFAFKSDSVLPTPSVLLEVTFRDTATRAVLSFGLRDAIKKPQSQRTSGRMTTPVQALRLYKKSQPSQKQHN